jgi:AraC-like DNA-binding protein
MEDPALVTNEASPRGILDFGAALKRFELRRFPPQGKLAPWIEGYWQVSWDLGEGEEHVQSNISHASVNIAFAPSDLSGLRGEKTLLGRLWPEVDPAYCRRLLALPSPTARIAAAASLGLGERALKKLFKAEIGIGPKEVLRRFRLQAAAERLARPDAPS